MKMFLLRKFHIYGIRSTHTLVGFASQTMTLDSKVLNYIPTSCSHDTFLFLVTFLNLALIIILR